MPEPFVSAQEAAKFVGISDDFSQSSPVAGSPVPTRLGLASCAKHGFSACQNSPPRSIAGTAAVIVALRKMTERIIQLLGVPY